MTQQMSQNNRPQPQNYELSSFYQASSQSTSGHNQQILAQHNQQRGGIRRASFPTAVSQPSQYMPLPNGPNQVVQQPSPPQMGPPTQLPPQYNPGQSHRLNAPSEAPPWSAPPGPSMPTYGLSGIHNQAQPQIRPHSGMSSGGEPILPGDGTSRQSHSVPTTPTQGYSEPSHSVLSIRTPNSVSRPSSSSSSSPRVYLPPPPVDESTIITSSSLKNRSSGAGVGASLSRPSSSSSRPGSRQQSVALPSPLITQPQPMLSISQPVIGPNFASLHPSASNSPVPRADSHPQSAPANMLGAPIPMKRESSISVTELRQMSEEQSRKRMRVDTESRSPATEPPSQPQPMATPAVSPVAPPPVASPAAIVVKGEIMDDVPMSFNSGYGDGDVQMGNEDEVIVIEEEEVGPDGLRLVSNCLPDVYDTVSNEDGSISNTCKLCQHRYSLQLLSEPPSPFINATDDDLEKHCLDDHESVWMRIRDPS
ncbi:hypothetical protein BJ165DRAFT_103867 [Panaeolus papilionaceus]|nr:hypothetical protein BJ165DRAFT_103867 [Panaeolus papilionaceus]